MRVLLTGMTRKQAVPHEEHPLYYSMFRSYWDVLKAAGHEVDWRPVSPGEELRGRYDAAIIGMHLYGSTASKTRKYGAFWAAHELPHVIAGTDWKVRTMCSSARSSSSTYVWRCVHFNERDMTFFNAAFERRVEIEKVVQLWRQVFPTFVMPALAWSDLDVMHECHQIKEVMGWYVNDAFPQPEPSSISIEREKRWVLVSLSQCEEFEEYLRDSGAQWPIVTIGPPAGSRAQGGLAKKGFSNIDWKMPEAQVYSELFSTSRGVLLPYYGKVCPPAWWRSRWLLSALAGSVLHVHPKESTPNQAHRVSVQDIENASQTELNEIAVAQSKAILQDLGNMSSAINQVNYILSKVSAPVKEEV